MTSDRAAGRLALGAELVRVLLPHRPPFILVDTLEAFAPGEHAALVAAHHISPNEPVFAGHFPDLHLWPGVYTIEGLAQSCLLLRTLVDLEAAWTAGDGADGEFTTALRAWQQALGRLDGAPDPRLQSLRRRLADRAAAAPGARGGLLVAADVKLVHPVFAGQRLGYHVRLAHRVGRMQRFDVEAFVSGRQVARGALTVAMAGAAG
jgi:3-hydroxyacyl-[acyl-carrier-protein] dehydratase